jgi:flagellar M-ring protein FliF
MQTIDGIQSARVHLVIPERQVFAATTNSQAPRWWSRAPVRWIAARCVRSSIWWRRRFPAFRPTVSPFVDDRGNLLAGGDNKSGPDALARAQDEDTANYENSLRSRIEAIVSSVVGMGRVQVQVAADINYNHTQTTSETYDPDSKVVRSTQTVEQNASNTSGGSGAAVSVASALPGGQAGPAPGGDQSKDTSGRTEETTNYEISKKVTTSTVDGGDIKKLSVAVVVDGSGDTAAAYKPRSADEMAKITALVKSAIGFDLRAATRCRSPICSSPIWNRAPAPKPPSRFWAWTALIGSRSSKPQSCALPRS